MSLDIGDAIKNGFKDTFTRNGLIFAGLTYLLTILSSAGTQSAIHNLGFASSTFSQQNPLPLALGGPTALWAAISFIAFIGTVWLSMAIIRSFANRETETLNTDYFKRNAVLTLLNLIIGGLAFGLAVFLGLIFLIIPGVFLAVSLIFWNVYVAAEDQNFIEGFRNSWDLARGNRIELFLLGLVVVVIGLVVGIAFEIPTTLLGFLSPTIGALLSQVVNAFTTVFGLATLVSAYNQLR